MIRYKLIIAFLAVIVVLLFSFILKAQPFTQCALTEGSLTVSHLSYHYKVYFGNMPMDTVSTESISRTEVVEIDNDLMTLNTTIYTNSTVTTSRYTSSGWRNETKVIKAHSQIITVVNVSTFKILSQSGFQEVNGQRKEYTPLPTVIGSYYWVPPTVKVGDTIKLVGKDYTVIGEGTYTAVGRTFDCWKLEGYQDTGYMTLLGTLKFKVTVFADKKTGIVIASIYELVAPEGLEKYQIKASGGGLGEIIEYHNVAWDCETFGEYVNPCISSLTVSGDEELEELKNIGIVTGSGTENDPYVIHGCSIFISNAGPLVGIKVENTHSHLIIENCRIQGFGPTGIVIVNSENVKVRNCYIELTQSEAIKIDNSRNIEITDIYLADTSGGDGIVVESSDNVKISRVSMHSTIWEVDKWFIKLIDVDAGEVSSNVVRHYYGAFYISGTTNVEIHGNKVADRVTKAIYVDAYSTDNTIYNNLFKAEQNYEVEGDGNNWYVNKRTGTNIVGGNYIGGNYWSDYHGEDTDGDGIGDTDIPYGPGDMLPLVAEPGEIIVESKPDIAIEDADIYWLPSHPRRGEWVQFYVRVRNIGEAETGWFRISLVLYYSDETIGMIHTATFMGNCTLQPGEEKTVYLFNTETGDGYRLPDDMSPENAYIIVVADSLEEVDELSEANNYITKVFSVSQEVVTEPPEELSMDFEIRIVSVSGNLEPGGYIEITAYVTNYGEAIPQDYLQYITIQYGSNLSSTLSSATLSSLASYEFQSGTGYQSWRIEFIVGIPFYQAGTITAVRIDAYLTTSLIQDSNPENNEAHMVVTLRQLKPDLIIQSLDISPEPLVYGEAFTATVTLGNIGGTPASNFEVTIFKGTQNEQTQTITQELSPGDTVTITFTFDSEAWSSITTPINICVEIDTQNTVDELLEDNNEKCITYSSDLPDIWWWGIYRYSEPIDSIHMGQYAQVSITGIVKVYIPSQASISFKVKCYIMSGNQVVRELREVEIVDAQSGYTEEITVSFVADIPPGSYDIVFIADEEDEVPEYDELNNRGRVGLIVYPNKPPLVDLVSIDPSSYDVENDLYLVKKDRVKLKIKYKDYPGGYVRDIVLGIEDEEGNYIAGRLYVGYLDHPSGTVEVTYFGFSEVEEGEYYLSIMAIDDYGAKTTRRYKVRVVDIDIEVLNEEYQPPKDIFCQSSMYPSEEWICNGHIKVDLYNPTGNVLNIELVLRGVPETVLEDSIWRQPITYTITPDSMITIDYDIPFSKFFDYYMHVSGITVTSYAPLPPLPSKYEAYLDIYGEDPGTGLKVKLETIDLSFSLLDMPAFEISNVEGEILSAATHTINVKLRNIGFENTRISKLTVCEIFGIDGTPVCGTTENLDEVVYVGMESFNFIPVEITPGTEYIHYRGNVLLYAIVEWVDSEGYTHYSQTPSYYIATTRQSGIEFEVIEEQPWILRRILRIKNARNSKLYVHIVPQTDSPYIEDESYYQNSILIVYKGLYLQPNIGFVEPQKEADFYIYVDPTIIRTSTIQLNIYEYDPKLRKDLSLLAIVSVDVSYTLKYRGSDYRPQLYGWHFNNWGDDYSEGYCSGMTLLSLGSYELHTYRSTALPTQCEVYNVRLGRYTVTLPRDKLTALYPVLVPKSDVEDIIRCLQLKYASFYDPVSYPPKSPNEMKNILTSATDPVGVGMIEARHSIVISGWIKMGDTIYFYGYDPNSPITTNLDWVKIKRRGPITPLLGYFAGLLVYKPYASDVVIVDNTHPWTLP